jgi:DNA-directed RNA polymerase subunit RPC12/RpoP
MPQPHLLFKNVGHKSILSLMSLVNNDFMCPECKKCFSFFLNLELSNNYRIHCPICGHMHYRKVSQGIITDIRFTGEGDGILIEDIYPMKSSCKDAVEDTDKDSYFYCKAGEGFLHRRWKETVSQ